jgi:hypothetical protein
MRGSPPSSRREGQQGRKPVSVEEENCGWDLTSLLDGQTDRYIEVKGRAALGGVALTPNEWIKARWLSQTSEELTLRHCAYWISLKGHPSTTATSTIRVTIPLTNIFSVEEVSRLMQQA